MSPFLWVLLEVCDLCDPLELPRTLPRGSLQHWPRQLRPLSSGNQIFTPNPVVQKQR